MSVSAAAVARNPANYDSCGCGATKRKEARVCQECRVASITHCPQGHPYDESNTHRGGGRRTCRQCKRERAAQRRSQPQDRERHMARRREWWAANRERLVERKRRWAAANRERINAQANARRLRQAMDGLPAELHEIAALRQRLNIELSRRKRHA